MNISEDLSSWAAKNSNRGAQAKFADQVAKALQDEDEHARWSVVDVRREFESKSVSTGAFLSVLNGISGVLFIVPIFIAWFHLHDVFSQFRDAVRLADKQVQINFLAFWTGAYQGKPWAYQGMSASSVALLVLLAVLAVIAVQSVIGFSEHISARRDQQLDGLITEAVLIFAKRRAITPEEMAGAIKEAARELAIGLGSLKEVFEGTKTMLGEVEEFATAITESAGTLSDSSDALSKSLVPLTKFSQTAHNAEQTLNRTIVALDSARAAFAEGVKSNGATLATAQAMLSTGVKGNVETLEAAGRSAKEAANAVSNAVAGLAGIVDTSLGMTSAISGTARELGTVVGAVTKVNAEMKAVSELIQSAGKSIEQIAVSADSPQVHSYVTVIETIAGSMSESAKALTTAVAHMDQQLANWTASVK